MTEAELAAIEARANAATPGPWGLGGYNGMDILPTGIEKPAWADDYWEPPPVVETDGGIYWRQDGFRARASDAENHADRDFLLHARADVPALVAEVRRLREALHAIATDPAGTARWCDCPRYAEGILKESTP